MFLMKREHNPPHIHAVYGEYVSLIDITTGKVLEGDLPKKALSLVLEWLEPNKDELIKIWDTQEFKELPPLV
jgi:hypothetical protein